MAPLQTIICTLAIAATTNAFTSAPIHHPRTQQLSPLWSDKSGGSAIAAPKTKIVTTTVQKSKQKSKQKKKFKPSEPDLSSDEDFEDAPMFRLYFIADEGDDQQHVVEKFHEIVEDCSEDDAATLFKSGTQTGEAFMGKYPKEIAETYCEQLIRCDPIIYADVRDDQ